MVQQLAGSNSVAMYVVKMSITFYPEHYAEKVAAPSYI